MKKLNAALVYLLAMFTMGLTTKLVFTTHIIYRVQVVDMDALQLVLAGTALEVAVFLFEIPTGIVADIYSRRLSGSAALQAHPRVERERESGWAS